MNDYSRGNGRARIVDLEAKFQQLLVRRSRSVKLPDPKLARKVSRQLLEIAQELEDIAPTWLHRRNVVYSQYCLAVSSCVVAQLSGDFAEAKTHLAIASEAAKHFRDSPTFFPNYFHDESELASYDFCLDAVQHYKSGQFRDAADQFERWLTVNARLRGKGNPRYDGNMFHHKLCLAIDSVVQGRPTSADWDQASEMLSSPHLHVYRTSRALWDHVEPLRLLVVNEIADTPEGRLTINALVERTKEDWRLLLTGARLAGKDRHASLEEPVRLPSFLELPADLAELGDSWRMFVVEQLRNVIRLKADFETKSRASSTGAGREPLNLPSFEIERLVDRALLTYTEKLIAARQAPDAAIFRDCVPLWFDARRAAEQRDVTEARRAYGRFLAKFRSVPHVVRILRHEEISRVGPAERGLHKPRYDLTVERVWNHEPRELTLQTALPAPRSGYACMRPRWNRSLKPSFRIQTAQDVPVPTRMPAWMSLFERWSMGRGPVAQAVFLRWCRQIEFGRLPAALRLLTKVEYFNEGTVRAIWLELYQSALPASLKGNRTLYVGLGKPGKSGDFQLYWLKQALSRVPVSERSFEFSTAFRTEDGLSDVGAEIDSVVFVDDFIGTGSQAVHFAEQVAARFEWLRGKRLFLIALAGFADGIEAVESGVASFGMKVLVGRTLSEDDRAFAPGNSLWDSDADRSEMKSWCLRLGVELLGAEASPHALGWLGSEALIAFHYNTPNNTLPLFWADGQVNGRRWHPLFPRY